MSGSGGTRGSCGNLRLIVGRFLEDVEAVLSSKCFKGLSLGDAWAAALVLCGR